MRVDVVLMPLRDVQRLAIDSYNEQHEASENYASHKSDGGLISSDMNLPNTTMHWRMSRGKLASLKPLMASVKKSILQ